MIDKIVYKTNEEQKEMFRHLEKLGYGPTGYNNLFKKYEKHLNKTYNPEIAEREFIRLNENFLSF